MKHSLSLVLSLALLIVVLAGVRGSGQSCDCKIGFPQTAGAVTVDGVIDDATEYAGAFVLDTATNPACLKQLYDWTGASPTASNLLAKAVKVLARRDAANNLFLAFRIKDSTQPVAASASPGERLIVQFDPDDSHGAQLSNGSAANQKDYRIEVTHKWSTNMGNDSLNFSGRMFYDSTLGAGIACPKQRWQISGAVPAALEIVGHNDGSGVNGGYSIEMKIPASVIGLASFTNTSTVGVAFAVVNDLGNCVGGACESTATSFPATIPVNNVFSPLASDDLAECSGLLIPDAWATGFFGTTPPIVEIKRDPVWWSATSVEAFACQDESSSYTYFSQLPCKIRIRAKIENNGPGSAGRNLLFLWGSPGVGQTDWRYIDLRKNVNVPAGGTFVDSAIWDNVPRNLGGHPCVRVYVLPSSFLPGFTEARMTSTANTLDATYIADLESTYRTGATCMAQKNLNQPINATCTTCPVSTSIWSPFTVHAQEPAFPFMIPAAESRRLTRDKTVAQIEAFGKATLAASGPIRYDFIEPIGGAIQLLGPDILAQPLKLVIGNPERFPQRVFVSIVARGPDGNPVALGMNFQQGATIAAHEERKVTFSTATKRRCFGLFASSSSGSALMLLVGLALIGRRAWRS